MKQLVISEIKKLCKNRLNQVLLCLTVLVTIGLTVFLYYGNGNMIYQRWGDSAYDFEGNTLNSIEKYRYADEILSQYEGEWNEEKLKHIEQESLALMEKYPLPINEEKMKESYGNNYQELLRKSQEKTLTRQELKEFLAIENKTLDDVSYKETENDYVEIFIYYGDSNESFPIETYLNIIHGEGFEMIRNNGFNEGYFGIEGFHQKGYSSFSSPVPHNILVNVFNQIGLPVVICLMIMLANIYGVEKQNNMEQMIYATKLTKQRILQSKFIAGIIFSTCVGLLALVTCFIVGNIILPIHSFQMPVMDLGSSIVLGLYDAQLAYWQLYFIFIILFMMGIIAIGVVTMFVSYLFKSQFKVIIILMLTLFMTTFLQVTIFHFPFVIRSLLPQSMCYYHLFTYVFGTFTTGELPFVFGNVPLWIFVIGVWLVIMVAVYFFISRCGKKSYVWR